MATNNDGVTDQLEEVSGRWLRDQLREVGDPPPPDLMGTAPAAEASTTQLIEGLARSISSAVVEPMRGLEARRESRQHRLEEAVQELSAKLGDAFVEIAKLKDQLAAAKTRADEDRSTALREIEAVRTHSKGAVEAAREQSKSEIEALRNQSKAEIEDLGSEAKNEIEALRNRTRQDLDQITAGTTELSASFSSVAEEIGRMQAKLREQHERIDALRFRETQRAKAMNELAKASSSLKDAVAAAAAMSATSEDEQAGENRG